jgi:hypothetical protein
VAVAVNTLLISQSLVCGAVGWLSTTTNVGEAAASKTTPAQDAVSTLCLIGVFGVMSHMPAIAFGVIKRSARFLSGLLLGFLASAVPLAAIMIAVYNLIASVPK